MPKRYIIMKKVFLTAAAVMLTGVFGMNAQAVDQPSFGDNMSIGLDGGVVTPMHGNAFFGSMRGAVGIHVGKQLTPVFGLGAEGIFGINTSSWKGMRHSSTAFDNSYVGLYGTADLFNLFGAYKCAKRPFTIEAVAGAGWGHDYVNSGAGSDYNYFATRVGLNFNFNVTEHLTVAVKPMVLWNMNGKFSKGSSGYNINQAAFGLLAGVSYTFGDGFKCVRPYDQGEVNALNDQINVLRGNLDSTTAANGALTAQNAALQAQVDSLNARQPQVVHEVNNMYNSVRFVFFRIGSHQITADQMPNVTMIADYMNSHPNSKVVIKGYASRDGNYDFNVRLAAARAEAVKNALIQRYRIPAARITAEGEGIGNMFEEESWNRVSICTLEQ